MLLSRKTVLARARVPFVICTKHLETKTILFYTDFMYMQQKSGFQCPGLSTNHQGPTGNYAEVSSFPPLNLESGVLATPSGSSISVHLGTYIPIYIL